ncbi:aminotransferase class I/II-fold pyridoxal phosphate-dependent enzyme [Actinosynnema sp. NPDC023794]
MVSRTGARLAADTPAIAAAHFAAEANPYHSTDNPRGYINLGTAESRLVGDLLGPVLAGARPRSAADAHYGLPHGSTRLRTAVAHLLGTAWRADVDPEHLVVVAGATAALDIAATVICDPGDAIVVPTPYYSAFNTDLTGRSGARLAPVPMSSDTGFALDPVRIDQALKTLRREGATVRAVAITSPANPHGRVHPAADLRALLRLTTAHDIDLISDEVYTHSVFGPNRFTSVFDPQVIGVVPEADPDRVHVVWGFAKDFSLPGLKLGVLRSSGPAGAAAKALAYFATVSADTQALLADVLEDEEFVRRLLTESRRRLEASYTHAAARLAAHGIDHVRAEAGFSLWVDLTDRLTEPTFAAEDRLWKHILAASGVNVLPGGAFGAAEPGWFRLCHAVARELVAVGIDRLARAVTSSGGA